MGCTPSSAAAPARVAYAAPAPAVLPEPPLPTFPPAAQFAFARLGLEGELYGAFEVACGRAASGCGTLGAVARRLGVPDSTLSLRATLFPEQPVAAAAALPADTPVSVERLGGAAWRLATPPLTQLAGVLYVLLDRCAQMAICILVRGQVRFRMHDASEGAGAISLADALRLVDTPGAASGAAAWVTQVCCARRLRKGAAVKVIPLSPQEPADLAAHRELTSASSLDAVRGSIVTREAFIVAAKMSPALLVCAQSPGDASSPLDSHTPDWPPLVPPPGPSARPQERHRTDSRGRELVGPPRGCEICKRSDP